MQRSAISLTQSLLLGSTTRRGAARDRRALGRVRCDQSRARRTEWKTNVTHQPTVIFSDISNGTLPAVSWVVPDVNSDHPGNGPTQGLRGSRASLMRSAKQVLAFHHGHRRVDDWGGFYDHVRPRSSIDGRPGFSSSYADRFGLFARRNSSNAATSRTPVRVWQYFEVCRRHLDLGRLNDRFGHQHRRLFRLAQSPRTFKRIHRRIPENILSINRRRTSRSIRNRPDLTILRGRDARSQRRMRREEELVPHRRIFVARFWSRKRRKRRLRRRRRRSAEANRSAPNSRSAKRRRAAVEGLRRDEHRRVEPNDEQRPSRSSSRSLFETRSLHRKSTMPALRPAHQPPRSLLT